MITRPEDLTREERDALQKVSEGIRLAMFDNPKVATRKYHACEVWPAGMLFPQSVRSIIRHEVAGMAGAEDLEEFAEGRVTVNGIPFLVWEGDPEVLK